MKGEGDNDNIVRNYGERLRNKRKENKKNGNEK